MARNSCSFHFLSIIKTLSKQNCAGGEAITRSFSTRRPTSERPGRQTALMATEKSALPADLLFTRARPALLSRCTIVCRVQCGQVHFSIQPSGGRRLHLLEEVVFLVFWKHGNIQKHTLVLIFFFFQ